MRFSVGCVVAAGVRRACLSVCCMLVAFTSVATAASPKTVTVRRCGYMHQILPGGPLATRGTYAIYGWHLSCSATRALLASHGSHLPPRPTVTATAVLSFRGMDFACSSGDAGGGFCRSPYRLRPAYPGAYVLSGRYTRFADYQNCSFADLCRKTLTVQLF